MTKLVDTIVTVDCRIHSQSLSVPAETMMTRLSIGICCVLGSTIVAKVKGLSSPPPLRLKRLLDAELNGDRDDEMPILLPCCYDGLTARLIGRAGFEATFMTGFGVSGTKFALRYSFFFRRGTAVVLVLWVLSISHTPSLLDVRQTNKSCQWVSRHSTGVIWRDVFCSIDSFGRTGQCRFGAWR